MDVKCGRCLETNVIFSHAQDTIICKNCKNVLSKPTGGKCQIAEGNAFRVKNTWKKFDYMYVKILIISLLYKYSFIKNIIFYITWCIYFMYKGQYFSELMD